MARPDGTLPTPEELVRAVLGPVTVNWKHRPDHGR